MFLDPAAVRKAWTNGAQRAVEQLDSIDPTAAAGRGLAELAPTMSWAAGELDGITNCGIAVLRETGEQLDQCLAEFAATDDVAAETFTGVSTP